MGGTYELGLPTSVTVLFPATAASSAHTDHSSPTRMTSGLGRFDLAHSSSSSVTGS